jgi:hypothetical protein
MIGSTKANNISNVVIVVDGAEVRPGNKFELLGVMFDQRFTVRPYLTNLSKEARFRAGRVAGLAQHLPRGQLLPQLGSGLLMGKLAHCLSVVAHPRLPGSAKPISEALDSIQVAINDVARSVVGYRREDHIPIKDLLVVRSTTLAAWSAYVSNDGEAGNSNPVIRLMFDSNIVASSRPTRATATGEVRVSTRGVKTLVTHALKTWNSWEELRNSTTKA